MDLKAFLGRKRQGLPMGHESTSPVDPIGAPSSIFLVKQGFSTQYLYANI